MTETLHEVAIDAAHGRLEIRGRTTVSWVWKVQPWWWFYNSAEPTPPPWYKPDSKWRLPLWYVRNPLVNFTNYVIGVVDRNYDVIGQMPVGVSDWNDVGKTGWKRSVIQLGRLRLPFVSYSGAKFMFHIGWLPGGNFGTKFNLLGRGESAV